MVKISDVARHAGVSPSTVSYVLSGKRAISAQTRQRVLDSIDALGYQPHAGARALAGNRANVIALVVPLRSGIHVPVAMQFAVSVVTSARAHDHDVLLLTQAEGEEGLRRVAESAMVDAIIVMDVELHDARIPALRSLGRPSVLIGVPADTDGLTCVDLDFDAAGRSCVQHLADLGHERIALIGQPPQVYERETGFAQRTLTGFQHAARQRGIDAIVRSCGAEPEAAVSTAKELLAEHPDLTGVVVHNEPAVAPLLDAFRSAGRRVPEDLSVVAIGPEELAERAAPPLSAVTLPTDEVGSRAVGLLIDELDGEPPSGVTLLPPRLTARDTTAPRPFRPR